MSEETTFQVRFWSIRKTDRASRPWRVRWVTAGKAHSESYITKPLAEAFRADLVKATRAGEAFDIDSGLPTSMIRKRASRTFLELAVAYIDHIWATAPPNTRRAAVVNLAAITPKFVHPLDHAPDETDLQRIASTYLLPPPLRGQELTTRDRAVASWLRRASRQTTDLADPLVLGSLLHALGRAADGRTTASSTLDKRRAILHRVAGYAVDTGLLTTNPVSGRRAGTAPMERAVDPRAVVSPTQARQLLAAVTYVSGYRLSERDRGWRLRAFFACMYYAGLRPGEAQQLRDTDCTLPPSDWGELVLSGSLTGVSGEHYNDGLRDPAARPLKRRRREAVRRVPIPPPLVAILREHLDAFGTTRDGRLFHAATSDGRIRESVYARIWKKAREVGLSPTQVASPLAARPYDLRHAALSSWLNAGVPPTEVAERAGHTVAVLLSVYAACIDGERAAYNARIQNLLDGES